jgi:hypothetical protein
VASTDILEILKHTWKETRYMYLTFNENIQCHRIDRRYKVQEFSGSARFYLQRLHVKAQCNQTHHDKH